MSSPTRASSLTSFLPLAPTTSASYPANPPALIKASVEIPAAASAESAAITTDLKRRSSSVSSGTVPGAGQQRFLKLGPIHHGVQTGDWSEL